MEFTLDFPNDLAGYTTSERTSLSNASNATVTRFVRSARYSNDEATITGRSSPSKPGNLRV